MRNLRSSALTLLFILTACRAQPTPTPSYTPTAPASTATVISAQATPSSVVTPTLPPVVATSALKLVAVGDQLTLTLPPGWQERAIPADQLRVTLAALEGNASSASALVGPLAAAVDANSTALVAWLPDAADPTASPTSLIAVALPSTGLSLESYLADAQARLTAQPDVTVASAQLDYSLRTDGIPVAVLQYTVAASGVDGYQVALLDDQAEHLVLVTFTTPAGQLATHLPDFQATIRSLTWK